MDDIRLSLEDIKNNVLKTEDAEISLERGPVRTFVRKYTTWRRGFAPSHFVSGSDKRFQLPDNSALHFVTNFLTPSPDAQVDPDLSMPFVEHETWRKFFAASYDIPSPKDPLFPVTDLHIFQKGPAKAGQVRFYNSHPGIKRVMSDGAVGKLKSALIMYDYGILHRTKIPGQFRQYRMTDLILRSMLSHIVNYPYRKNHFVYIPLSDRYYPRNKFLPAFRMITNSTLRIKGDPSYDFLIHFLGFVYGFERPFDNVILSPNDENAIKKDGFELPEQPSTSLFNRLNDDQLSLINVILDHKGETIIYNMKQLKELAESKSFFLPLYKHVMKLKARSLSDDELKELEEHGDDERVEDGDSPETHTEAPTETSDTPKEESPSEIPSVSLHESEKDTAKPVNALQTPPPVKDVTVPEDVKEELDSVDEHLDKAEQDIEKAKLDDVLDTYVKDNEDLDSGDAFPDIESELHLDTYIDSLSRPEQKRARKLLQRLDTLEIGGKTLRDHLDTAPKSLVSTDIVNDHTRLIDPETKASPIFDFDQQYLNGNLKADLAKTITSFMKQGFFVANVDEKKEITRIDSTTTYKVRFISVSDGKQHTVSFTLPNVDNEGVFKDNGNEYRLIKQKTAVPIAKISPWKVGLFSSYNKATVERTRTRRSFGQYILKILERLVREEKIKPQYGHLEIDSTPLPLEYSFIAERYSTLEMKKYKFIFNYSERFDGLEKKTVDFLKKKEIDHGVYCGQAPAGHFLFYSLDNHILAVKPNGDDIQQRTQFLGFLEEIFPDESFPKLPYEYTLVTIISQAYPVIFLLGLMHGLLPTLKHIRAKFRFVPKGKALKLTATEARIRFKDGSLVYNRYPLLQSFILSGLSWCVPEDYNLSDFENEDTYFDILLKKGISTNQIKGIKSFFDLFIDPITRSLLENMNEPTNVTDLLIRATEMLTSMSHYPASSERNYRFRSFERFPSIVYNEIARAIASYQSDRTRGKTLNVNPKAVYQKIYSDPAKSMVDTINPIHEIKDVTKGSYAGIGGRNSRSFVVNDRTFSPDSVGVISEATPDSGKVGMIFSTVMDPNVIDLYGRTIPHEPGEEITSASKLMSVVGNLLPGLAQDDKICLL